MHLYPSLCQKRMQNSVKLLRFNVLQSYGVSTLMVVLQDKEICCIFAPTYLSGNLLYLCTDVLIMSVLILLF